MAPIGVGLAGTGIFATANHLPALQQLNDKFSLVACTSRTKERARQFASKAGIPEEKIYESLEEMVEDPEIQLITSALPPTENLRVVTAALKSGKPVAVEKPIAGNLEDAEAVLKLSESTDIPVFVMENVCFRESMAEVKKLIPRLGKIVAFNHQSSGPYDGNSKYLNTSWRLNPHHIGGYLSDGGVHDVAILTEFLGEVASVFAVTHRLRETSGVDDMLYSTMEMVSGAVGNFSYCSTFGACEKKKVLQIFGTEGCIVYDYGKGDAFPTVTFYEGASKAVAKDAVTVTVENEDKKTNGVKAEYAHIYDVLSSAGECKRVVPVSRAYHHLAIIAAFLQSSKEKAPVQVKRPEGK